MYFCKRFKNVEYALFSKREIVQYCLKKLLISFPLYLWKVESRCAFFDNFFTADGSIVYFLRKINAKRATRVRGKKGEPGGQFDSLSAPPPLSRGTAACAVKKHGRYEFRFTLRGSSTHRPIKKLRCAALVRRGRIVRPRNVISSLSSPSSSLSCRRCCYRRRANAFIIVVRFSSRVAS